MKAKPPVLKDFARKAYEAGVSLRTIARTACLPVGTIKTWMSRGKWERAVRSVPDETPAKVEKKGGDETGGQDARGLMLDAGSRIQNPEPSDEHRGLKACHMPGARSGSKQMTFALFKRNLWPPAVWKVPPGLVGGELLMMLQERSCMNLRKKGEL